MKPAAETGLVISGGGAYGAFAVGVMKGLFSGRSPVTDYQPLDVDILTGTSVGAFNASMLLAGSDDLLESVLHLERVWTERIAARRNSCGAGIFRVRGDFTDLLDPYCASNVPAGISQLADDTLRISGYLLSRTANFVASSGSIRNRVVGLVNLESFVDASPFDNLLRDSLDAQAVASSRRKLCVVATNWVTGKAEFFDNSQFAGDSGRLAVLASSAIPGLFPPVRIQGRIYVDGGVVQNTPLKPAIRLGATEIHSIYLDPDPDLIPLRVSANSFDTLLRVYYLMLSTKIAEDIKTVKWINDGLEAIADLSERDELGPDAASRLTRVAGKLLGQSKRRYKHVTVHRYFPNSPLGGDFGMVDFDRDQILRLIQEGEQVALTHDCYENRCVF